MAAARLRHDLFEGPYSVTGSVVAFAGANALMALLVFCYLRLGRPFRVLTLTGAVAFSLMALATSVSTLPHVNAIDAPVPIPALIVGKCLLALAYCMCVRLFHIESNHPPAEPGAFENVSRSKRLCGVANAAPISSGHRW